MSTVCPGPLSGKTLGQGDGLKPSVLWKVYFWLATPGFLVSWVMAVHQRWSLQSTPFAPLLPSGPFIPFLQGLADVWALAGLYGYAFQRKCGPRGLWVVWLPLYITSLVVELVWDGMWWTSAPFEFPAYEAVLFGLMSVVPVSPLVASLYLYAFRSPSIWEPQLDA